MLTTVSRCSTRGRQAANLKPPPVSAARRATLQWARLKQNKREAGQVRSGPVWSSSARDAGNEADREAEERRSMNAQTTRTVMSPPRARTDKEQERSRVDSMRRGESGETTYESCASPALSRLSDSY